MLDSEESTADTLQELPLTGFEPGILALSLVALIAGTWLVRRSGAWQRLRRLQARAWRRDAPQALAGPERAWPPTALDLRAPSNVEFRRLVHHLAEVYGVSVMEGIDAYATRVAATFDPAADPARLGEAVAELANRDEWVAPLDMWTLHLAMEVARLHRR